MSQTPVLALLDFLKEFQVHTNASGERRGAVLVHEKSPLAYLSKSLGP